MEYEISQGVTETGKIFAGLVRRLRKTMNQRE
jgi:hypothetical protein